MSDKTYLQRLKEKEAQEKKDKRLVVGGLTGVAAALFLWQGTGQDQDAPLTITPYEVSQNYSSEVSLVREIPAEWQEIINGISPYNFVPFDVPEELLANRDFVIAALSKNLDILHHVSAALRNDRAVITQAINTSPIGLAYASDALKSDKDMVLYAVSKNAATIHFADQIYRSDWDVMRILIEDDGRFIASGTDEMRGDRQMARAAVRSNVNAYSYISDELKADIDFAKEAVSGNSYAILFMPIEVGLNPEIYSLTNDALILSQFVRNLSPEEVSENPELLAYINYLDVLHAREGGFDSDTATSLKYGGTHHALAVLEDYKAENPDWFKMAEAAKEQALEKYDAEIQSQEAEAEGSYWTWKPFKGFYPKHWDTQPKP